MQVTDSGPGLPEEDLPKVFSKFYRAEGSLAGGLGLGLSIVRGFVEAHNGQVTAENIADGGARFSLQIPSENPVIENLPFEKS